MPNQIHIEQRQIGSLAAYAGNARQHPKKQVRQIAESIRAFGFIVPVLVDAKGGIMSGHGRIEAAKLLGMSEVPVISIEHLSEEQKRAFILADNKIAAGSRWDQKALAIELGGLIGTGFDVSLTGFETPEIDLVMGEGAEEDDEEFVLEDIPATVVSQPGDLWQL
ncbi:MAG: ParB/Srx family N-terminal domain-containing protein, partial [Candidatus Brocadiia bacterium]